MATSPARFMHTNCSRTSDVPITDLYDFPFSMIMWHHRRRTARAMAETRVRPPVYQVQLQNVLGQPVSVDRWLEEQNVPANAQQYDQDTW